MKREKRLRPPIVLAVLKLLRRLPGDESEAQLSALLLTVGSSMKSRDAHQREVARTTMAKVGWSLPVLP